MVRTQARTDSPERMVVVVSSPRLERMAKFIIILQCSAPLLHPQSLLADIGMNLQRDVLGWIRQDKLRITDTTFDSQKIKNSHRDVNLHHRVTSAMGLLEDETLVCYVETE